MSPKDRLLEDRAMRDAARNMVGRDWRLIKGDLQDRGVAARIADTAMDGARSMVGDFKDFAQDNRGVVGGGFAAFAALIGLWLFGERLIAGNDQEPDDASDRSKDS